ncbi:hypothetical protein WN48_06918 [Eufriesea mexicana]|uniref:Uncharacterized protein n=1 Tax=Eufriesea mexicana TaxID=516756 RepID=A0A310SV69_9HYME|nr:hypothetical protein WN48_06918 [Eufriesea mexicana]
MEVGQRRVGKTENQVQGRTAAPCPEHTDSPGGLDRPATTSLPSEESGSLRDRTELATAIHAPREKQGTQEWKLRTAMNISHLVAAAAAAAAAAVALRSLFVEQASATDWMCLPPGDSALGYWVLFSGCLLPLRPAAPTTTTRPTPGSLSLDPDAVDAANRGTPDMRDAPLPALT